MRNKTNYIISPNTNFNHLELLPSVRYFTLPAFSKIAISSNRIARAIQNLATHTEDDQSLGKLRKFLDEASKMEWESGKELKETEKATFNYINNIIKDLNITLKGTRILSSDNEDEHPAIKAIELLDDNIKRVQDIYNNKENEHLKLIPSIENLVINIEGFTNNQNKPSIIKTQQLNKNSVTINTPDQNTSEGKKLLEEYKNLDTQLKGINNFLKRMSKEVFKSTKDNETILAEICSNKKDNIANELFFNDNFTEEVRKRLINDIDANLEGVEPKEYTKILFEFFTYRVYGVQNAVKNDYEITFGIFRDALNYEVAIQKDNEIDVKDSTVKKLDFDTNHHVDNAEQFKTITPVGNNAEVNNTGTEITENNSNTTEETNNITASPSTAKTEEEVQNPETPAKPVENPSNNTSSKGWRISKLKTAIFALFIAAVVAGGLGAALLYGIAPIIVGIGAAASVFAYNTIVNNASLVYNKIKDGKAIPEVTDTEKANAQPSLTSAILTSPFIPPVWKFADRVQSEQTRDNEKEL